MILNIFLQLSILIQVFILGLLPSLFTYYLLFYIFYSLRDFSTMDCPSDMVYI